MGNDKMSRDGIIDWLERFRRQKANAPDPRTEDGRAVYNDHIEYLRSFDREVVEQALRYLYRVDTNAFFPKQHDLIRGIKHVLTRELPDRGEMWEKVLVDVSAYGPNKPQYHPVVESAIRGVGGWESLQNTKNTSYDREAFFKGFNEGVNKYLEAKLEEAGV